MKYQIKILLLSFCIFGLAISQIKKKETISQNKIMSVDPDTKNWDDLDKNIKDPELQKLFEELKKEFRNERDILKKDFKKKMEELKNEYSNKRKDLRKKYKKEKRTNKKAKPLDPNKKKDEVNSLKKKDKK